MAESYSIEAVLSAVDKSFGSTLRNASRAIDSLEGKSRSFQSVGSRASSTFKSMLGAHLVGNAISKMGNIIGTTMSGMVGELNNSSKAWQTFDGNLSGLGWGRKQIDQAKVSMQDYATKTIYSASEMAMTFSQMAAIGRKDSGELVEAMGGLAASAENPKQAMKTLSQQMTQALTKPKIQWQDFKLMMEQSPAGMAAVAKKMGMSLDELVTKIQKGEIQTEDFAEAVKRAGNDTSMQDLATRFKSVDEAMDGLNEGISNKLLPIFNVLNSHAIKAISGIIEKVSELDFTKIAENIDQFLTKFESFETLGQKVDFVSQKFPILKQAMAFLGTTAVMTGVSEGVNKLGLLGVKLSELTPKFVAVKEGAKTFGTGLGKVFTPFTNSLGFLNNQFPRVSAGFSNLATRTSNVKNAFLGAVGGSDAARSALSFLANDSRMASVAMRGLTVVDLISSKMSAFGQRFPMISNAMSAVSSRIPILSSALSGIGGTFGTVFSGMGSIMTTFAGLAMRSLMPAALFGVFLAGLGLLQGQFGDKINQLVQVAVTQGPQIITNLVNGIVSQIPQLVNQGTQLITQFTQVIVANAPAIFQGAVAIISALVQGVGNNSGQLISSAIQIVGVLVNGLISSLPQLLSVGMNFLVQLAQGIVQSIPTLLSTAQSIVTNFVSSVNQNLPGILQSGIQVIMTLVQGIISNLPNIISTGISIIQTLLSGIAQNLPLIVSAGFELLVAFMSALVQGAPQILEAGKQLITGLGSAMLEAVPQALSGVWDAVKSGFSGMWDAITGKSSSSKEKVKADAVDMTAGVQSSTSQMASNTSIDMTTFMNSINLNMSQANSTAKSQAQDMQAGVNSAVEGMSLDGVNQTLSLADGIGTNITTANANATSQAQAINANVTSSLQGMQGAGTTAVGGLATDISSQMTNASSTVQSQMQVMSDNISLGFANINNTVLTSMSGIAEGIQSGMNAAKSIVLANITSMRSAILNGFNSIKATTQGSMNAMVMTITSGFNRINSTSISSLNRMTSTFNGMFNAIKSQTSSAMASLNATFTSGMSRAVATSMSTGNRIISIFRDLASQMSVAGSYAGQGFASGLAGSAGAIYAVANSIANNVAATIRRALSIRSPSRVMKAIGGFTGEGMAIGMQDSISHISKSARAMATAALPELGKVDSNFKANFASLTRNLQSTFSSEISGSTASKYEMNAKSSLDLNLNMGGHVYRAFTNDINEDQMLELALSHY